MITFRVFRAFRGSKISGLTQNQILRGHHADPFFTDAEIVQ